MKDPIRRDPAKGDPLDITGMMEKIQQPIESVE
jgi:hypothetical protein